MKSRVKKEKMTKNCKKPIYIIVNGQYVDNKDCDYCNYDECESCPTWHGEEIDDDKQ